MLSLSWFSGLKEALPFQSDELTSGGHERVFPGQRWGSGLVQGAVVLEQGPRSLRGCVAMVCSAELLLPVGA